MTRSATVLAGLLVVAVASAWAQGQPASQTVPRSQIGRPLIDNFTPADYGGGAQNWAIVQDRRGILYIGSTNGIIEYDGVSWRRIGLPGRSTVRSLAQSTDGRIYVGGVSEFGYLESDVHGEMRFVSLIEHVWVCLPTS